MKKKGNRSIPDFSRKAPRARGAAAPQPDTRRPSPPAPHPTAKPAATSSKSGRRGQ